MGRKTILFVTLAALILLLSSCQLAQEEQGKDTNDRLVGVYITTSPLDQFDADAFLDDYIQQSLTGENVAVDDSQYAEKLYGNLVEGEDGPYYTFEGVEGFPFYTLNINQGKEGKADCYLSYHLDGSTLEVDRGSADPFQSLEATLYVPTGKRDYTFFFNPMYQTQTGAVYLVSGTGFSSDLSTSGGSMSQEIKRETTVTTAGKTTQETVAVKCTVVSVDPTDRMVWVQMDESCQVLATTEVETSQVPATFTPAAGTAFILVEYYKADQESPISREIFGKEATCIPAYETLSGYALISHNTEILWE